LQLARRSHSLARHGKITHLLFSLSPTVVGLEMAQEILNSFRYFRWPLMVWGYRIARASYLVVGRNAQVKPFRFMTQEIERVEGRSRVVGIPLQLHETDIPHELLCQWLRKSKKGKQLILPTSTRLTVDDAGLTVQMIVHDPDEYCNEYYESPDFDDDNPPIAGMRFEKEEILSLVIGGRVYRGSPTAVLVIKDPLEYVKSLRLTFTSLDANNPLYMINGLTKKLGELGVTIEEVTDQQPSRFW
jgi:hypothetical protein